jgi:hypothetical protein
MNNNTPRTIKMHTYSRITLEFLKNMKNQNYLIEKIRKKTTALEKENWNIEYTWIKHMQDTMETRPPETVTYATRKSQKLK